MILPDDADDDYDAKLQANAGASTRRPTSVVSYASTLATLPAYETSEIHLHPIPPPPPERSEETLASRGKGRRREGTYVFGRRLDWRAVLIALVLYTVITTAITIPIAIWQKHRHHKTPAPPWRPATYLATSALTQELIAVSVDADAYTLKCNNWHPVNDTGSLALGLHESTLQYIMPLNGSVFIRSNVSHTSRNLSMVHGNLLVDVSDQVKPGHASVNVSVQYFDQSVLDRTSVCLMQTASSYGLSILVPDELAADALDFSISLLLPKRSSSQSTHINELLTYLPLFAQQVGDIQSHIAFDDVTLEGPMSGIVVDTLQASTISVKTSLAQIQGTFSVSSSLSLGTIGGPIHATVSLFSDGDYDNPTFLEMNTGNGEVNANITLTVPPNWAPTSAKPMPNFHIQSMTFNEPLSLGIAYAPQTSLASTSVRAVNSLAHTNVTMDALFTGSFDLQTQFGPAVINEGPAYMGAPGRWFDYEVSSASKLSGWVGVGKRPQTRWTVGQGHLELSSSLSPVCLNFAPSPGS